MSSYEASRWSGSQPDGVKIIKRIIMQISVLGDFLFLTIYGNGNVRLDMIIENFQNGVYQLFSFHYRQCAPSYISLKRLNNDLN